MQPALVPQKLPAAALLGLPASIAAPAYAVTDHASMSSGSARMSVCGQRDGRDYGTKR
jgi:hypothetical protein